MNDQPRPLTSHLEELRNRLYWVVGAWLGLSLIAGAWVEQVYEFLMHPAIGAVQARGYTLITVSPPELLFVYIKSALLAGFLGSLPITLYQLWAFIAPGLYSNEKRLAIPFVLCTTLLFLGGCTFGYLVPFPFIFEYFLSLEAEYVQTQWTTQMVFAFMWRLYMAFGIAFQLPIVIFFLALARIVTPQSLAKGRRYAIVVMFVVGAIITPPDVISQVMLAIPLILLYESGILISYLVIRRRDSRTSEIAEDS